MTDEQRYTLEEAAQKLREELCLRIGHSWDTVMQGYSTPVSVICTECGVSFMLVDTSKMMVISKKPCDTTDPHGAHTYDYDGPVNWCNGEGWIDGSG